VEKKETFVMTPAQEEHLREVKEQFALAVDLKYRKGEEEHGGNLWENKHLLDEAINEAIDLFVYLITLRRSNGI
jgi:hypothetical protein